MRSRFENSKLIILCILSPIIAFAYLFITANSLLNFQSPISPAELSADDPILHPISSKVVFVLIDGLRVDTSLDTTIMPNLNSLRSLGAWGIMHSRQPSYSQPAYTTLFTGSWPGLNGGPLFNLPYNSIPAWVHESVFSAMHSAGISAAISGYHWFEKLIPQDLVKESFYTPSDDRYADESVVAAALPWIDGDQYQFVLIHLDQLDHAGHNYPGVHSVQWEQAAQRIDKHLQEIVSAMDLSTDTLVVVSDHGHIDSGGHGGGELAVITQPYLFAGAGVVPGEHRNIQMVDIAPTIAALLGVSIPSSNQGIVLTELLSLTDSDERILQEHVEDQQRFFYTRYAQAFGYQVPKFPVDNEISALQEWIASTKNNIRREGRAVRAAISLTLFLIPLIWILKSRDRFYPMIIALCLLYHILFNTIYTFVFKRVYTFSAINDPLKFILTLAAASAISFVVCWLVLNSINNLHGHTSSHSRKMTLKFTLITIFSLLIPLLWNYYRNGIVYSKILPEFSAIFIAILSSIQLLFIPIISLILVYLNRIIDNMTTNRFKT